jgi:hypothetical protein
MFLLFGGGVVAMAQDPGVPWWATGLFGLVGIAGAGSGVLLSKVTVTLDDSAVEVEYGLWHWPVQRFAMQSLSSVEAVDISPLRFGGWGYRWVPSRRLSGAILRKGPGLLLHRLDGRTFAVTVDDAAQALSRVPDRLAHP